MADVFATIIVTAAQAQAARDAAATIPGGEGMFTTGQGLTDKATLVARGWTVTTN